MRRTILAFIGGLILGAAAVVAGGYVAGFERPSPPAPPEVARLFTNPVDDYAAVERRIPRDLQDCVARDAEAHNRQQQAILHRELVYGSDRALGRCLARARPAVATPH